jgi:hypothetical protein
MKAYGQLRAFGAPTTVVDPGAGLHCRLDGARLPPIGARTGAGRLSVVRPAPDARTARWSSREETAPPAPARPGTAERRPPSATSNTSPPARDSLRTRRPTRPAGRRRPPASAAPARSGRALPPYGAHGPKPNRSSMSLGDIVPVRPIVFPATPPYGHRVVPIDRGRGGSASPTHFMMRRTSRPRVSTSRPVAAAAVTDFVGSPSSDAIGARRPSTGPAAPANDFQWRAAPSAAADDPGFAARLRTPPGLLAPAK